jgi:very-short-patch-repair endonuclease
MTNKILPYNKKLKHLARELRKNSTLSEVLLWKEIKRKKLGFEFHRQVPIKNYIVDFYCHELQIAIEIDGFSHDNPQSIQLDKIRQTEIEELGVKFIRIDDLEVKTNLDGVLIYLKNYIDNVHQD